MTTMKHLGANSLVARLTAQLGSRDKAIATLRARGHMEPDSERLTPAGQARDNMTAAERAKASGRSPSAYKYDPRTNRATLMRGYKDR